MSTLAFQTYALFLPQRGEQCLASSASVQGRRCELGLTCQSGTCVKGRQCGVRTQSGARWSTTCTKGFAGSIQYNMCVNGKVVTDKSGCLFNQLSGANQMVCKNLQGYTWSQGAGNAIAGSGALVPFGSVGANVNFKTASQCAVAMAADNRCGRYFMFSNPSGTLNDNVHSCYCVPSGDTCTQRLPSYNNQHFVIYRFIYGRTKRNCGNLYNRMGDSICQQIVKVYDCQTYVSGNGCSKACCAQGQSSATYNSRRRMLMKTKRGRAMAKKLLKLAKKQF